MRWLPVLILPLLSITSPVLAGEQTHDPNRLVIGGGTFNVLDDMDAKTTQEVRVEARLSEVHVWKLHPWIGIEHSVAPGQNDRAGYANWYGGGLETDIDLWRDRLVLTLQTGAGYFDDGHEPDNSQQYLPKSGFEFRHTAELGWRLGDDGARFGIGISHMSNANLGGGNNNVQAYNVNVHFPLDFMSGKTSKPVN